MTGQATLDDAVTCERVFRDPAGFSPDSSDWYVLRIAYQCQSAGQEDSAEAAHRGMKAPAGRKQVKE